MSEPSNYRGTIELSYQQMWEVHKAISARVFSFVKSGEYENELESIEWLLQVAAMLDLHVQTAVEEYEAGIAKAEAAELSNDDALRKFLESDS